MWFPPDDLAAWQVKPCVPMVWLRDLRCPQGLRKASWGPGGPGGPAGPGDRWLVNVGDVLPKMSRMFQASKYSIMFKHFLRIAIYIYTFSGCS
jgi:hypothetical protein